MIRSALSIQSDLTEVASARDWVSALAHRSGFSQQEVLELQLAVSEACTNAIKHAYSMERSHTIELSATIDDDQIQLVIRDFGKKMDFHNYQKPDLETPSEGGYGIYLLLCLMDEVSFNISYDEGTELMLVKRRCRSVKD